MKNLSKLKKKSLSGTSIYRKLIRLSVKSITPYQKNARNHPDQQLNTLCRSIQSHGFVNPVIVDENNEILAGHGRYLAALKLKLKKIPVLRISGLSEKQKKTYRIADNKIALMSSWDKIGLKSELEDLVLESVELEDTGFTTGETDLILDEPANEHKPDKSELLGEDLDAPFVARKGDIWAMGDHKLICGDSLKRKTFDRLMGDEKANLIVTDPPYNVGISGHVCGSGKIKHDEFAMASGEMTPEEFTAFLEKAIHRMARFSKSAATAFYFMDWRHMREIMDAAQPVYGPLKQLCVWVKDNGGMGSFYRSRHELIFVFLKQGKKGINNFQLGQFGRYRTNVWEYPGVNTFKNKNHNLLKLHPTVKPVSMIADILRDCSRRGDIVLDGFSGSGTTILAAEKTGRKARAIEYEPKYVDVTLNRWMRATGIMPILEKTGQTYEEVKALRLLKNGGDHE